MARGAEYARSLSGPRSQAGARPAGLVSHAVPTQRNNTPNPTPPTGAAASDPSYHRQRRFIRISNHQLFASRPVFRARLVCPARTDGGAFLEISATILSALAGSGAVNSGSALTDVGRRSFQTFTVPPAGMRHLPIQFVRILLKSFARLAAGGHTLNRRETDPRGKVGTVCLHPQPELESSAAARLQ